MSKKKFFARTVFAAWLTLAAAHAGEDKIRVLILSATSSQDAQFDLTSLLDGNAKRGWKPGIAGTGAEEGIFLQFEKPVKMDAVQLHGEGSFVISMNDEEINEKSGYFYVPGRMEVKTLFVHVASHPTEPVELTEIKLCRKALALRVEKPLIIPGSVQAVNSLNPQLAYGPARLFDSRPDLAFALDGKKIDPRKPVPLFDLKFKEVVSLKGFFIWNGYQRSEDLYVANSRPKVITVRGGDSSFRARLADKTGPQWVQFPDKPWDVSSMTFTADEIIPGRDYKDLVVSEICFVTEKDEILMVKIPLSPFQVPEGLSKMVNQTLASFSLEGNGNDGNYSLKLRGDGTFAAFQQTLLAKEIGPQYSRKIWEGNWVPVGPGEVRVFGKAYSSEPSVEEGPYGTTVSTSTVRTFQTILKITDLSNATTGERERIFKFVKAAAPEGMGKKEPEDFWKELKNRSVALFVESNLFSQVMVRDEFKK